MPINCFYLTLIMAGKDTSFLFKGMAFVVLLLWQGVSRTQLDKAKDALSGMSVVVEYVGIYIMTFVSAVYVSTDIRSLVPLYVTIIISLVEILVFLLITYWYPIRRFVLKTISGKD